MDAENMEISITSEMISQQIICGETERPNKDQEFLEIAKIIPWTCNNDNAFDETQSNEEITEIEQTTKNLIKAKEVYFNYTQSQKMARTKHSVKKRVEEEHAVVPRKEPRVQKREKSERGKGSSQGPRH